MAKLAAENLFGALVSRIDGQPADIQKNALRPILVFGIIRGSKKIDKPSAGWEWPWPKRVKVKRN